MSQSKKKNRVVSLRFKTVAVIIIAALILSAIAVTISYSVYSNTMDSHYKTLIPISQKPRRPSLIRRRSSAIIMQSSRSGNTTKRNIRTTKPTARNTTPKPTL